ncbi:MAG TPA: hypothetical protein VEI06_16910 [Gemmatimonadaceae bacterium]|nr:hypothetical protein [Gemmatimonadaceae bacterium]
MKASAFAVGLCISAVGILGVAAPSALVSLAQRFVTPGPFYVVAMIRIAFGILLISVASATRSPRAIRILGYVIVVAGVAAGIAGMFALAPARESVAWWLQQPSGVWRLTSCLLVLLGGFVAYSCAPIRRSA